MSAVPPREGSWRMASVRPALENVLCLDFEASGLGPGSYPIEVAIEDCRSSACTSWLIRPTELWRAPGVWSEDASALHKIALSDLVSHGQPAEEVAHELADRCMGKTILCDGGDHDRRWLVTLFQT